jgi:hypothetical protein
VQLLVESRGTFKDLTVIRDASTLVLSEKGKPVERRGRKATGLKEEVPMTAGLPRSRHGAAARTPFLVTTSSRVAGLP